MQIPEKFNQSMLLGLMAAVISIVYILILMGIGNLLS